MIVRERQNEYIMIEQDHHARISGQLAANLKDSFFIEEIWKQSVLYAIENHDYAWRMIDKQPFWNDQKQEPFMFTDIPNPVKTVFYKHGIDEVEKHDSYAALLCSEHYTRFLIDDPKDESQLFVQNERDRQQKIIHRIENYDKDIFGVHYSLLQFFDSLSLYLCLNEPGSAKKDEHPFFKDGIPVPQHLTFFHKNKVGIYWKDNGTVEMDVFPFGSPIDVTIRQKAVPKKAIAENGLISSYELADVNSASIQLF
ncbi:hypothetical protein GCM10007063_09010 [Lentibacillus kapialis]|uniref:DUF3891 family protein n=1 Tax=Lentibacillus kapialis TaxID=340214 RepID=A0A917PR77_9BACI|nr:DUF3891 family protein [Lentibacillus kapialis]GGJ88688.1 hypothetical protein GCM10007063_09010 [Lentibacillus kapialis]